ncbi:MAG: efflux RND transporter periplasmic adaptor subunit [Burkholderiaceae bacterium]|nr:efflux RND transporter periplasmic adaptor subunit [Burkholderiales bacterium]MCE2643658.1 efflux RND transporter periplasmic adaptor subunit [Burkholderiaceae bacterium]
MTQFSRNLALLAPVALAVSGLFVTLVAPDASGEPDSARSAAKPALAVTTTLPKLVVLPVRVQANGNIAAWQEAIIGTEADGLRLAEVNFNVGDVVRRGQVLARFASATVDAELAQSRSVLAEAEAILAEASSNAVRAQELKASGALSEQQIQQYLTAERTARARLEGAKAAVQTQQLRLAQTQVLAPDDGVISVRTATVGAVLPSGQELFRIIRRGRLEWRAEVAAPELVRLRPGQQVTLTPAGGQPVRGMVRVVAPVVDTRTRSGLVYVDIPVAGAARAGMFARGEIEVDSGKPTVTLPQAAVAQRDGFSYVMRIGPDYRVMETKVTLGRRAGDRVEVVSGIDTGTTVVASGVGFLGDGDLVQVVDGAAAAVGAARSPGEAPNRR